MFIYCSGKEDAIIFQEANQFDFWGKQFPSEDDAYEMYNEYAFMKGFEIKVGRSKRRRDDSFSIKRIYLF